MAIEKYRVILSGLVLALADVSGFTRSELFSPNCWKGEKCCRKDISASSNGIKASPCKSAVQLRPRKHGQQALGSLSNGEKQRVKAELLCKGQNRAAHKVVPAWSGRQEDS